MDTYDPRTDSSTRNYGDNGQMSDTWRATPYAIPIYSSKWPNDGKHIYQDIGSGLRRAYRNTRRMILQCLPSSNRHLPRSTKSSSGMAIRPPEPSNVLFVFLCCLWYTSSALSSNTGKSIMIQFRYPVTLTFVQFGFVAVYCLIFMTPLVRFSRLRLPTRGIIRSTLPMGVFQVGGHIFSSIAISRIPVSTVHSIKALSPLFTVTAYAVLFGVSYSAKTYISLLPLTIGVIMACSFDMSASNAVGLLCAFGSALVFVSSNIFFKKIMPSGSHQASHKLDKLNLLLYSSSMAFILMIPLWAYYDLPLLLAAQANPHHISHPHHGHDTPHSVTYYFFMNGTVHFAQNIIAFIILSSTSPVTYSIASLIKRVAVICIAILWFNQSVHLIQAFGIVMTFTGLYMYNNAKSDVERGEKKMRRVEAARELMLPTTQEDEKLMDGTNSPPTEIVPISAETSGMGLSSTAYGRPRAASVAAAAHSHYYDHYPLPSVPNQAIPPPILSIKTTSKVPSRNSDLRHAISPTDLYPSPPPSLDSPPSNIVPLGYSGPPGLSDIQERLAPVLEQPYGQEVAISA